MVNLEFSNNKHPVNNTSVFLLILVISKHIHSMALIFELSTKIAFNRFIIQEKSYLLMYPRLTILMSFVALVQKKQIINLKVILRKTCSNELYNHVIAYLSRLNGIDLIIYQYVS